MHVAAIKAMSRKRRQFEECGAGIDQEIDAVARQHFAARGMPLAGHRAAATRDLVEFFAELGDEATHDFGVAREIL